MNRPWYKSPVFLWILTIVITLTSIVYQRLTGPTHPARSTVTVNQTEYSFSIIRSHHTTHDAEIILNVPDQNISGLIKWKRFKSHDSWSVDTLSRNGDDLIAVIPKQPMAGKVIFELSLRDENNRLYPLTDEPVIMRFTGPVPPSILWSHVLVMFAWMLLSTRTGLDALSGGLRAYRYTVISTILLIIGGFILGPIVQKFAFNEYWAGWPFSHDLTDNKTAAALIFWIIALWRGRKKGGRAWIVIAAIVTLIVYLIPHSLLGSELDYTKMEGQ